MDDDSRKYEVFPTDSTQGKGTINVYAKKLESAEPKAGDLLANRYQVLDKLGHGGMGVVYRCFDTVACVEVAVKAVPQEFSNFESVMEEIKVNFQLVSGLVHTNIAVAKTLERDPTNGGYYLVMELVEGEDLRHWMCRHRAATGDVLPLDDVLPILRQVASALDYAHSHKIIHRDIKPENIMVCYDGQVKVMDFGIAAQVRTSLSRVSQKVISTSGTRAYMAPEQWRGEPQGPATDQYSLAVMAYEMLSGHLPFDSPDPVVMKHAVLEESVRPIDGLPAMANRALKRALSKKASDRFPTCSEFVAALAGERFFLSSSGTAYTRRLVIGVMLVAVLAIAGVYVMRNNPSTNPPLQPPPTPPPILQLQQDVYRLQGILGQSKRTIDDGRFAPGQTFGKHLEAFAENYAAAEKAMEDKNNENRFHIAKPLYETAKEEAEWIIENAPLRSQAQQLFTKVEAIQKTAASEDGDKLASTQYNPALEQFDNARSAFEKGSFQEAIKDLNEARAGFENAKYSNVNAHLASAEEALKNKLWDAVRKEAGAVLRLEPDHARATQLMALAEDGRKQAEVQALLASAQKAYDNKDWKEAQRLAGKVIDFDAKNVDSEKNKARRLKEEAIASEKCEKVKELLANAEAAKVRGDCEAVQRLAEEIIAFDAKNVDAEKSKAKRLKEEAIAFENREKVKELLANAEAAKARGDWEAVQRLAEEIIASDAKNVEDEKKKAKVLKEETVMNLNTSLIVNVVVEGRTVLAPFTLNPTEEKRLDGNVVELAYNKRYTLTVTYTSGDDKWEGCLEFTANWKGRQERTVRLKIAFMGVVELGNGASMKLIKVKAGSFLMGSPVGELGRFDYETQHQVTLTQDYWLGETEVTQGQWKAVMGDNPSYFKNGDNYPVENVSWEDAMKFCEKLNELYRGKLPSGYWYSLPTEAQWEYACRAGTTTSLNSGMNITSKERSCSYLGEVGWYGENLGGSTHPVGQKQKNAWGFYDMHGNVFEWCSDWFGSYSGVATDPRGPAIGSRRVDRGGSWNAFANVCRSASRFQHLSSLRINFLGFRLALVPVQNGETNVFHEKTQENIEPDENKEASGKSGSKTEDVKRITDDSDERVLDCNGVPLMLIKVKPGSFLMGSPNGELGRYDDETLHRVTLTREFWLGETEVTQGQWKAVMGDNPSFYKNGDNYPVENVSWEDAMKFCKKLNEQYSGTLPPGYRYSLPTEAQWEYACRAGTTTSLNSGKDISTEDGTCLSLGAVGWYRKNSESSTHPVGKLEKNAWGFYDMHGNVWEWCNDRYGEYGGDATDPKGPQDGSQRVCRGGSWGGSARNCRTARRNYNSSFEHLSGVGFRLALVPVQ